ncbi:hypothetical protein ABPG72_018724 [Tetrahymena utriculariae]
MVLKFFECEKPITQQKSGQVFKYGIWDPHLEVIQLTLLTERHSLYLKCQLHLFIDESLSTEKQKNKKKQNATPAFQKILLRRLSYSKDHQAQIS